jgi:hypothetical protein
MAPRKRTRDLVAQQFDTELLLYDLRDHRAHCLQPTAARVWKMCDGQKSRTSLSQALHLSLAEIDAALDQLASAGLVEYRLPSRRKFLAAAAIPLVVSIVTPAAAQQAVSACKKNRDTCSNDHQCCPPLTCDPVTKRCH